ncbi:hypothetical protein TVAG_396510 [Trichomonas vaginalis G3]|uniref:Uncharacterized protein n=1 Tax=Trichomonas vaginalis (strain ATCC PRA-98 / G3) TaxID=412133 RepID=A2FYD0_TRIV3|nr:spectrin binding [Trichomonas vaginalis G3]EAX90094.1 hypothetical protein TVAG_396510 [Trichomonas vaginalis G3]KAI5482685.1 spectrin binding [Trichomonas vaginalis G3]|eukprot:XP_001303024.1 hypothetical protein [Trichomonas vaginalis G3]
MDTDLFEVEDMIWSCTNENMETCLEKIQNFINKKPGNADIVYDTAFQASIYRPKILLNLSTIVQLALEKRIYTHESSKTPLNSILIKRNIIKSKDSQNKTLEEILELYPPNSVQHALLWDNVSEISAKMIDKYIKSKELISLDPLFQGVFSIVNVAAYLGAVNIFNLLLTYKVKVDDSTATNAICGGNNDIINQCKDVIVYNEDKLHYAMMHYRTEMVDLISQKIGKKPLLTDTIRYHNTKLFYDLIQEGADVNAHNSDEKPPIILAASGYNEDIVRVLIEKGANVNERTKNNLTPIFFAAKNGCTPIFKLLLDAGADINAIDTSGRDVMLPAISSVKSELIYFILENGYDMSRNQYQNLKLLVINDLIDIMKAFLQKGAYKRWHKHDGLMECILRKQNIEMFKLVAEFGVGIQSFDSSKMNLLMMAASLGNIDACKYLLDNNVDVNAIDLRGKTALHFAVKYPTIIKLLISKEAKIDAKCSFGSTPLIDATKISNAHSVHILLKNGADPNIRDSSSNFPLSYAIMSYSLDVMTELAAYNPDIQLTDSTGRNAAKIIHQTWTKELARPVLDILESIKK